MASMVGRFGRSIPSKFFRNLKGSAVVEYFTCISLISQEGAPRLSTVRIMAVYPAATARSTRILEISRSRNI